jgi:tetratricopeptide (TPR) repeat protein
MSTILDFQIQVLSADNYTLTVLERGVLQPLATSTFNHRVDFLTDFSVDRLNSSTKDADERFDELQKLGQELYQKLFQPSVKQIWHEYKQSSEFLILCLRFAEEAVKLEVLPWETMYDGEEFISAGVKTTLSRLPLNITPQHTLPPIPRPLKLFGFFASPLDLRDHERLNVEREQEILLEAINDPTGQGRISADFEDEAKLEILDRSLREGYHILHFSGHGISPHDGGGLLLEDAQGRKLPTSIAELIQIFKSSVYPLRLAVLSGCQTARTLHTGAFSDLSRELLRQHVSAVIAMQFSITDIGGLKFAEVFYKEIVRGVELELAIHAARRALLDNQKSFMKNDALAIVLLTTDGACLKTTKTEAILPQVESSEAYLGDKLDPLAQGFYGRRREYRKIRDGLQQDQRAIIIHGIGGIGKTALLSHIIIRLRSHFKAVMSFDCRRAALVPETVLVELHRYFEKHGILQLQTLIGQNISPESLAIEMAKLMIQWPILIVFDNFETQLNERHEIIHGDFRVFLSALVQATTIGSRFLFTTRYLFDIKSEQVDLVQELPLDDLSRAEALMLMQKLPNLTRVGYLDKLTLLEKFGGHPFALIMLDRNNSHQLLDQTLKDADLLKTELRKFLAIELNYHKLSARARELLNRLAAFRKTVSVAAAEWVLGKKLELPAETIQWVLSNLDIFPEEVQALDNDTLRQMLKKMPEKRKASGVMEAINELVLWGLVTPHYENNTLQALSVHSLVRDYCREQHTKDWSSHLYDAAAFYTNVTKILPDEHKNEEIVWGDMEAFELLMEGEDFAGAFGLLRKDDSILDRWGYGRYLEIQYRRLLKKLDPHDAAVARHDLGLKLHVRGEYDAALQHYQLSLTTFEEMGNHERAARCLHQIGRLHQARGDYDAALQHHQLSLKIRQNIKNHLQVGRSLHQIGAVHQARGDFNAALQQYQLSLKVFEEIGARMDAAHELYYIGLIHQDRGNYEAALQQYQLALKIRQEVGDQLGILNSIHRIGLLHQARGDHDEALMQFQLLLKLSKEVGGRRDVAIAYHLIGESYQAHGDHPAALEHFIHSLRINEELGEHLHIADSFQQIGNLHQICGDYDAALDYFTRSVKINEEIGNRAGLLSLLQQLGELHKIIGDYNAALQQYHRLLKVLEDLGNRAGIAASFCNMGLIHLANADNDAALEHFELSLKISEEIGYDAVVESCLHQIGELHQTRGNYDAALQQYERLFKIKKKLGNHAGVAKLLQDMGLIYLARGDFDTAMKYHQLSLHEDRDNPRGIASSLHNIGVIHIARGEFDAALQHYQLSLDIYQELGDSKHIADSLEDIGVIYYICGDINAAIQQYKLSINIHEELGDPVGVSRLEGKIGVAFMQTEHYAEAFRSLIIAFAVNNEMMSPNTHTHADNLKNLRIKWNEQEFDAAWKEATDSAVPQWLKETETS